MSDVLEKIRRLVALASSPNENEARNAALKACRLILEHKVKMSVPVPAAPARDSLLEDLVRQKEAAAACMVFGHFWSVSRVQVTLGPNGSQVRTRCSRCGVTGTIRYTSGSAR